MISIVQYLFAMRRSACNRDPGFIAKTFVSAIGAASRLGARRLAGIDFGAHSIERGYFLMNPICFAIAASSIRVGRSLGNVQFLKR
jgi:hypothetical protein